MTPSSIISGALIFAGLAGAYFLLVPLLILANQRFRADVHIVPFDPAETPPPPALAEFFRETDFALVGLGFRCLGSFVLPDAMPNVQGVLQLYANDKTRDAALVTALYATVVNSRQPPMQLRYTEFVSRFTSADLRIIHTNNTDNPGSLPPLATDLTFRFPHIEYLVTLYRLHEALVQRHAGARQKTLRVMDEYRGDAVAYLRDVAFREAYQDQVPTGYLRRSAGESWRPTIKGAYLMTWKELWPIKQIIRAEVRRKAKLLERDLGIRPEVV